MCRPIDWRRPDTTRVLIYPFHRNITSTKVATQHVKVTDDPAVTLNLSVVMVTDVTKGHT